MEQNLETDTVHQNLLIKVVHHGLEQTFLESEVIDLKGIHQSLRSQVK